MHKVFIQAYAALGEILQSNNFELSTSAKTVEKLIDYLAIKYSPAFKEKILSPNTNEIASSFRILINGQDIMLLKKLQTPIKEGDKILFFPPVSGG